MASFLFLMQPQDCYSSPACFGAVFPVRFGLVYGLVMMYIMGMFRKKLKFRNHPRRDSLIGMGVVGVLLVAFAAVLVECTLSLRQSYVALKWDVCPVQKVEKTSHTSHGKRGGGTSTSWVCHYVYQGVSYKTDDKGCGEFDSDRSTRQLKKWQVYVNPADPSEAVMSPGGSLWSWGALGLLALVVPALAVLFVMMLRCYRRDFAGKPVAARKVLRADPTGLRVCKWDRFASLDELLDGLHGAAEDTAMVENVDDAADGVQVLALEDGGFQLCTGEDAEWVDSLASPLMSREEVVQWMDAYQSGVPIGSLTQGWEEL